MSSRIAFLFVVFLCFVGCQSAPKRYAEVFEGQWRAKALVKDLEESRSYIVNLNINLIKNERARMDVSTALGTGVASLVVADREVRYVLVDSKRFYVGAAQANVMRPILSIPFDPRWLNNILLEEPIQESGWTCARDGAGFLKQCQESRMGLKVIWSERNGDKKTVLLEHSKASVQIKVQSFKPKVEERKNLFVLEAPEGYKKLNLR